MVEGRKYRISVTETLESVTNSSHEITLEPQTANDWIKKTDVESKQSISRLNWPRFRSKWPRLWLRWPILGSKLPMYIKTYLGIYRIYHQIHVQCHDQHHRLYCIRHCKFFQLRPSSCNHCIALLPHHCLYIQNFWFLELEQLKREFSYEPDYTAPPPPVSI